MAAYFNRKQKYSFLPRFVLGFFFLLLLIKPIEPASNGWAYKRIADQIAAKAKEKKKLKIAVLTYQSLDGQLPQAGEAISEEIINALVNNSSLNIVERSQVKRILQELQFNQTGAIDATTAKKIGNGLGADALVMGSFTEVNGNHLKVYTKLVDTETFQVLGANQETIVNEWKAPEEHANRLENKDEFSQSEVFLLIGAGLPGAPISTKYTINAASGLSYNTLTNDIYNIRLNPDVPLAIRFIKWGLITGFGFQLGYSSYQFAPQDVAQGSSGYINGSQIISFSQTNYYRLNIFQVSFNFYLRIPISPRFYPYVGIGYKASLQYLAKTGNGVDIYSPMSNNVFTAEFGLRAKTSPLQMLANLFTYIIGWQWYFTDRIGITLEYQMINYGDSEYLKTTQKNFTYKNGKLGSVSGGTNSNMALLLPDGFRVHNIHVGIVFKLK